MNPGIGLCGSDDGSTAYSLYDLEQVNLCFLSYKMRLGKLYFIGFRDKTRDHMSAQ